MCGICGIVNLDRDAIVDGSHLEVMNRALTHRGPDDEGYFVERGVGLGMRRLSIVDLEGGHQPIPNERETCWVVCNGEIYTYPALRRSLEHHGHRFRTGSDVEAILHAYDEYGDDFISFLNGMFAFALWDGERERLLLARDRAGIKPLYYSVVDGVLLFSSELKSLLTHPAVRHEVDLLSLNQYLSFEYVPTPRSIVKNVHKLPPGHMLEFSRSRGLSVRQYWDLQFGRSEGRPPLSVRELKQQLVDTLDESVRLELLSDVPVGVLLSGGLDSSSVAAFAMRRASAPMKTFTLRFEDASFDESRYAEIVARHIGSDHHVRTVTTQMILDAVEKVPAVIDEPFGDSSMVPTLLLSEFAAEHVKVVLGGDGGDELFAGYPTLQAHRLVELYERMVPHSIRASLVPRIVRSLPVSLNNISFDYKMKRFLAGRGVPSSVRHHQWLGSFTEEDKRSLFHPDLHYSEIDSYAIVAEHLARCDATETLNQLLYLDFKLFLEGDILAKVDRASMAHSLEVRVPLLNLSMLRFVSTVPHRFKLRGFTSKYLFKEAMRKYLPRRIITRPKKGFNIPVGKLFQNELREMLLDYLGEDRIKRQGLFNVKTVSTLIDDHLKHRVDNRKQLWTLFVFQRWYERTFAEPRAVAPRETPRPLTLAARTARR